jgi:molybdate transport system substrate-binding protein
MNTRRLITLLLPIALTLATATTQADDVQVAVAANFAGPAKQLAEQYARSTGHRLVLSVGSTGKLYAQVKNGAPYDVFLSADEATPRRLEEEKLAAAGSRFTYAVGKLVLWSPKAGFVDERGEVLKQGAFKRIAIANPKLAPYGAAAQEALTRLGLWSALEPKLVQGENIAQTFQFVATGNAELGFVALAQIREADAVPAGSTWLVPAELYAPIRQDAALLARASGNAAARGFLEFLKSPAARTRIRAAGYELP